MHSWWVIHFMCHVIQGLFLGTLIGNEIEKFVCYSSSSILDWSTTKQYKTVLSVEIFLLLKVLAFKALKDESTLNVFSNYAFGLINTVYDLVCWSLVWKTLVLSSRIGINRLRCFGAFSCRFSIKSTKAFSF